MNLNLSQIFNKTLLNILVVVFDVYALCLGVKIISYSKPTAITVEVHHFSYQCNSGHYIFPCIMQQKGPPMLINIM